MAYRYIISLVVLCFMGCSNLSNNSNNLLDYIPENAAVIIKINDLNGLKSSLANNEFITSFETSQTYKDILENTEVLDFIDPKNESILAFSQLGATNFEYTFVTHAHENQFILDSVASKESEKIPFDGYTLYKYNRNDALIYGMKFNDKIVISSARTILEDLTKYFGDNNKRQQLERLYKISNKTKNASVFINLEQSVPLSKTILQDSTTTHLSKLTNWVSLDLESTKNHLYLNGVTIANDTTKHYLSILNGTNPIINITPSLAPSNADAILSYTFDDYSLFSKNKQRYLGLGSSKDSLMNTVEEIGFIYRNSNKAVLLNTFGAEQLTDYVSTLKTVETDYQGNQIFELRNTDFLNETLNPIVSGFNGKFCTIIDNAFIFSSNIELIRSIIGSYKNKTTFDKTDTFISAKDVLADESSVLFVSNSNEIRELSKNDFSKDIQTNLNKAGINKNTYAAQVVTDDGFFHLNIVVQQTGRKKKINSVSPLFKVQFDEDLAIEPQFVINHSTKRKEIVVQDVANNLYLISSDGKVLWKKQLEGQIQGKIHQVDLYKNKRLQLAFTTNNQFIILDRNGKEVHPFNKKYEGGNLNGLAVFDYDNNKNYRFVVTQGNKVYMYNNKASIVKGFKYTEAESPIIRSPKHLRLAKKDYLVFNLENGLLKVLNRVGTIRTKVLDNIDFSDNEVYLYKNKFILTNKKGSLYQISTGGKINKTELRLNADHGIDATSKSLIYMNDNILNIKGKKVELDFGVYSHPQIFYVYDKIYVSVTDIQNQSVYLFDSQAKPISNFPVFGSSTIDMTDIENDRKLEIVCQDQKNSIIVYQMN